MSQEFQIKTGGMSLREALRYTGRGRRPRAAAPTDFSHYYLQSQESKRILQEERRRQKELAYQRKVAREHDEALYKQEEEIFKKIRMNYLRSKYIQRWRERYQDRKFSEVLAKHIVPVERIGEKLISKNTFPIVVEEVVQTQIVKEEEEHPILSWKELEHLTKYCYCDEVIEISSDDNEVEVEEFVPESDYEFDEKDLNF